MAANQVTVATPGPAGATGLVYEGLWVAASVYQVRDLVRFTDGNLYVCNVQHTATTGGGGNDPVQDSTTWTLFIQADDAFGWATKAKHTSITDSVGNGPGYSALHQAEKAKDWASKIDGEVTGDTNASLDPDGFSAKAYAIGGVGVDNVQGSAKDWAMETGSTPSSTAAEASAKEWAIGTSTHKNEGSAKDWAIYTTGDVRGASAGSMSAKEWAVGVLGRGVSGEGSSKDWATRLAATVDNAGYSAQEWAVGTTASTGGSAKDWAIYTAADVRGASSGEMSAKEWAVGVLGRGQANEGSSKDWATRVAATVDNAEYSAKEYSQGSVLAAGGSSKNWAQLATTPTTTATDASAREWAIGTATHKNDGSAKEWAVYTSGDVRGGSAGDMSSKEWAVGTQGRGVSGEGSSKDWATRLAATVDNADWSAKEFAIGTTASTGGSAKDWAIYTAADVRGASSGEMSSKEWAIGVLGRGQANEGSSKDWATRTTATVDNAGYSAKEHSEGVTVATGSSKQWSLGGGSFAIGTAVAGTDYSSKAYAQSTTAGTDTYAGSAKGWASTAYNTQVPGAGSADRSALHYSTDASNSALAAKASAAAVANSFDSFDDTYLGTMSDAVSFTGATNDFITSNAHGLINTQPIRVIGTDLPAGLSIDTDYYVRDKTTNTFKVETSVGGGAVNITDTGTGTQTWVYADVTTPTSSSWVKNSSTITVASNVGIRVGQVVTGSGISSSPSKPNVLSIDGTSIVISENMAAVGSSVAVTFANKGVYGTFNTTKDGPSTDNDGDALADGMLYFNSTDNQMMVYKETGASWIAASSSGATSLVMHKFTASGSETQVLAASFSPTLSYTPANIVVFLNGVRLDATDYTASNGNDITSLSALAASDEVVVMAFKSFEVANAVSTSGGTFAGAVTFTSRDIHNGGITVANDGQIGSVGDADSIAISSAGVVTMSQIPVFSAGVGTISGSLTGNASGTAATVTTASQPAITTTANLVSVGALNVGSITSGFTSIDVGAGAIATTGALTGGTATVTGLITANGGIETDTNSKVIQRGAFMQSSTHQSLVLGG